MTSVTIPEINFYLVLMSYCAPVLLDLDSGTYKNNFHVCNWNQGKPEDSITSNTDSLHRNKTTLTSVHFFLKRSNTSGSPEGG